MMHALRPRRLRRWCDATPIVLAALHAVLLAACGDSRSSAASEVRAAAGQAEAVASGTCSATVTSLTPASWIAAPVSRGARSAGLSLPVLRAIADVPLPRPANRFDYQSVDSARGRLYISHMDAGRVVVFDLDSGRVVNEVEGLPRVTGVWAVPAHHHVYASAAGAHEVAVIDDRTLAVVARIGGVRFPDGIGYAPDADKVFVSDEDRKSVV